MSGAVGGVRLCTAGCNGGVGALALLVVVEVKEASEDEGLSKLLTLHSRQVSSAIALVRRMTQQS